MIPPLWFRVMLVAWAVLFVVMVVTDARAASARPHAAAPMLPPSGPFPDAVCDEAARMDIYIAPDGHLYECVCEKLVDDVACDWFDQGQVRSASLRRRARAKLHVRTLPRLIVIRL